MFVKSGLAVVNVLVEFDSLAVIIKSFVEVAVVVALITAYDVIDSSVVLVIASFVDEEVFEVDIDCVVDCAAKVDKSAMLVLWLSSEIVLVDIFEVEVSVKFVFIEVNGCVRVTFDWLNVDSLVFRSLGLVVVFEVVLLIVMASEAVDKIGSVVKTLVVDVVLGSVSIVSVNEAMV